jgi:aromatic ring-opening dioxygenase LigB subunit
LVFACIVPHGFTLIPEISDDAEGGLATRAAMEEVGRRGRALQPDVLVVATPHGFRVDGAMLLAAVSRAAGTLRWQGRQAELNVPVDLPLTDGIAEAARARGVPVALGGYASSNRATSVMPMDWGTLTPVWFLGYPQNMPGHGDVLGPPPADAPAGPSIVMVTPSRQLPRQQIVEFGTAVAEAAERDGRRVALVASCDWAHAHSDAGPYGFHPSAAEVDNAVVEAVKADDLERLIGLDEAKARTAAIDGLWQTLILIGARRHTPMRGEFLSYEAPTYYGMIVAAFEPTA